MFDERDGGELMLVVVFVRSSSWTSVSDSRLDPLATDLA